MKAIYSLWTFPGNRGSLGGLRHRFGSPKAQLRMLALSMGYSLRWFGQVELWADEWSASVLDGLVPGARTVVAFKELDDLPAHLWSLGKLSAEVAQDGPYIHIDNDAMFVADPAPLISGWEVGFQSLDCGPLSFYTNAQRSMELHGVRVPASYRVRPDDRIYNCGILVDRAGVLRETTADIIAFARSHAAQLARCDAFATFLLEQGWQSAAVRGRPVGTLLNNPWDAEESKAAGFIHLLDAWKRDPGYEAKVAARLEREFPAIHNHIEHLA